MLESFLVAIATKLVKIKNSGLKSQKTGGSKMKKLILAGALVVGLSIPALAVDGIQGGYVATSAADSFTVQKLNTNKQSQGGYVATSAADALTVQKLNSEKQSKGGHVATSAGDSFVVQKLSSSSPNS